MRTDDGNLYILRRNISADDWTLESFRPSKHNGRSALSGSEVARQILRDETYLPNPGRVAVSLGPLVVPNATTENDWHEIVRLRDATREIVAHCSGEPLL